MSLKSDGTARTHEFPPLIDKWNEFQTKVCGVKIAPEDGSSTVYKFVKAASSVAPGKGVATASWGPIGLVSGTADLKFKIDVDYLVKAQPDSFFERKDFMSDSTGCN